MWSVRLVFCDYGFHSVCLLMDREKILTEVYWWKRLRAKLGPVWMGWAMFSKSLIQFSIDGQVYVPSLWLDLRANRGGGDEDNGNLLQKVPCKHCCTQCPQPWSRQLPTHVSTGDSWTLMGMSGQFLVASLLPSPGSLWAEDFVCALQKGLCHTRVCCPQSPCGRPLRTYTSRRHSDTVLITKANMYWVFMTLTALSELYFLSLTLILLGIIRYQFYSWGNWCTRELNDQSGYQVTQQRFLTQVCLISC